MLPVDKHEASEGRSKVKKTNGTNPRRQRYCFTSYAVEQRSCVATFRQFDCKELATCGQAACKEKVKIVPFVAEDPCYV